MKQKAPAKKGAHLHEDHMCSGTEGEHRLEKYDKFLKKNNYPEKVTRILSTLIDGFPRPSNEREGKATKPGRMIETTQQSFKWSNSEKPAPT